MRVLSKQRHKKKVNEMEIVSVKFEMVVTEKGLEWGCEKETYGYKDKQEDDKGELLSMINSNETIEAKTNDNEKVASELTKLHDKLYTTKLVVTKEQIEELIDEGLIVIRFAEGE